MKNNHEFKKNGVLFFVYGFIFTALLMGPRLWAAPPAISDAWYDRAFTKVPLKKILIIGLSKDDATRDLFETEFSKGLVQKGIAASPSTGFIPLGQAVSRDVVVDTLKGQDFDAVMVSRLVSVDSQSQYVPGTQQQRAATPSNRYAASGSFTDNYQSTYDTVYTPGYLVESKTVTIQTDLYSSQTQKLIWSGTSRTVDPNSKAALVKSLAAAMALELSKVGFISPLTK